MSGAGAVRVRYRAPMPRVVAFVLCTTAAVIGQQVPEAAEPNATVATATVLACGREGTGTLANATDVDWWKVVVAATADVTIETAPGPSPQIGDTVLTLLDATGAPLRSADNGVAAGLYSRLVVDHLAAGTYFVAVERGASAATTGSYAIDLRCAPPVVLAAPPIVNESAEPNDPRTGGTPTAITPDVRINGQLTTTGPAGDTDFYRFTLTEPGFVRATVAATATHPQSPIADDLVLYVYDNAVPPQPLASSFAASGFGAFDTELAVWLPAGTFQIAIRGWRNSTAGRYYLDVRKTIGARAATNVGGCGGRQLDVLQTNVGPGAPIALERPVVGRTYSLQGSGLGAASLGVHIFGVTPAALDLGGVGAPGCTLRVVWIDLLAFVADAAGNAPIVLVLGEDPTLLGVPLETQVAVLDGSNPLGFTFSNSVSALIGN